MDYLSFDKEIRPYVLHTFIHLNWNNNRKVTCSELWTLIFVWKILLAIVFKVYHNYRNISFDIWVTFLNLYMYSYFANKLSIWTKGFRFNSLISILLMEVRLGNSDSNIHDSIHAILSLDTGLSLFRQRNSAVRIYIIYTLLMTYQYKTVQFCECELYVYVWLCRTLINPVFTSIVIGHFVWTK